MIVILLSLSISALRSAAEAAERSGQKIALHGELPHLGLQIPDATLGVLGRRVAVVEDLAGVLEQLLAPGGDLGGVHPVP